MQVLGFSSEEQDTIFRVLASGMLGSFYLNDLILDNRIIHSSSLCLLKFQYMKIALVAKVYLEVKHVVISERL